MFQASICWVYIWKPKILLHYEFSPAQISYTDIQRVRNWRPNINLWRTVLYVLYKPQTLFTAASPHRGGLYCAFGLFRVRCCHYHGSEIVTWCFPDISSKMSVFSGSDTAGKMSGRLIWNMCLLQLTQSESVLTSCKKKSPALFLPPTEQ